MRRALLAAVALAASAVVAAPAAACADGHLGVRWSAMTPPLSVNAFPQAYWAAEPSGGIAPATLTIAISGEDCPVPPTPRPITATYDVGAYPGGTPRSATPGAGPLPGVDFLAASGQVGPLDDLHAPGPDQESFDVSVFSDGVLENVAEGARALITGSTGRRDLPFDVPLWIIDRDGLERAAFEGPGVTAQSEIYPQVTVAVFRAGPATGSATYALSAQGSGPSPASPGEDFTVPASVSFSAGERAKVVAISVVNDKLAEGDEELTLSLVAPGPVLPDDPTSTVVKILDNEEVAGIAPETRFHHPRHKHRYDRGDYRLREVHVFAKDAGGAGVARVEWALRRKLKKGCQWHDGKRFRKGACGTPRWLEMAYYPDLDWYYFRMRPLKPSVGTKVKHYLALSRAIDDAGNVETGYAKKRNRNRFEVLKKKK